MRAPARVVPAAPIPRSRLWPEERSQRCLVGRRTVGELGAREGAGAQAAALRALCHHEATGIERMLDLIALEGELDGDARMRARLAEHTHSLAGERREQLGR